MRVAELKSNAEKAEEIARNLILVEEELSRAKSEEEKSMLRRSHGSLIGQLRIINNSVPSLLSDGKETVSVDVLSINKEDRKRYMEELEIEKDAFKKLKSGKKIQKGELEYRKAGMLIGMSSGIFSGLSLNLSKGGLFGGINNKLRRANLPYLLSTYISLMLFISSISFIIALVVSLSLFLLGLMGVWTMISAIILLPVLTFVFMLYYPSLEANSNSGKIEDEMPFAVINMSAIAGSGVEPTKVFRILAESPEYPAISKEMRKLVNQINFYGYDLTTALSTTAKSTSSERFSELLSGMAMIISSGGNLQEYLNKKSEDTLMDYKLRRKRYVTVAETYADIYTGLLIAAPLMFMLLLTLINVIGGNLGGLSAISLSLIGLGAIALINVIFLIFIEMSAPKA